MIAYLSDEWLAELARLVSEAPELAGAMANFPDSPEFAVAQHITEVPGEYGPREVEYYILFGLGPARAVVGSIDDEIPHVGFTQSYATATKVAQGELSAQSAFMAGQLRVGGRVDLLTANVSILEAIEDVFGELRAQTRW